MSDVYQHMKINWVRTINRTLCRCTIPRVGTEFGQVGFIGESPFYFIWKNNDGRYGLFLLPTRKILHMTLPSERIAKVTAEYCAEAILLELRGMEVEDE